MAEPPKARAGWNDSFNKTLKGAAAPKPAPKPAPGSAEEASAARARVNKYGDGIAARGLNDYIYRDRISTGPDTNKLVKAAASPTKAGAGPIGGRGGGGAAGRVVVSKPAPKPAAPSREPVTRAGNGAMVSPKPAPKSPAAAPTKAGLSPFGTAFAAARKTGAKEFSFGGKSYTTKIKGQ